MFTFILYAAIIANAATAGEPMAEPPFGVWKQADTDMLNLIRFEKGRIVQYRIDRLIFERARYADGQIDRVRFDGTTEPFARYERKDDILWLTPPGGEKKKFEKLAKEPAELSLPAVKFAERKDVDAERRKAIQKELAKREEANIKVRLEWREAKDPKERAAKLKEMETIDADDTAYLVKLVGEAGWIDSVRFGAEAEYSAYLIVMHTRNFGLMESALVEIEKEARAKRFDAEAFAGLFDRFRTITAQPERYGMHITPNGKGELVVGPLENLKKVDEYRKAIGLPPLKEYLKRYDKENGGKPVKVLEG